MGTRYRGMRLGQRVVALFAIALLTFGLGSCAKPIQPTELLSEPTPAPNRLTGQIAEVSPPETLETLKQVIDAYTPQVRILSPRPGEVLNDTTATVRLQVRGLPLFQDETWQLGPHLHLLLDNEPYKAIYDPSEPLVFEGLAPGTHTLRVFATRPWDESFKNQGAFDQRTFHVYAPTPQNEVNAKAPLLTYSAPQGTYGAEPILLDFYLTNAPLHMSAQADNDDLHDWRIRCTVNNQSFVFDQWQPIWLKGFKPGRNWVQLELIDEAGNPIDNRFNNTVRVIDYQPGGTDTLSQLVRGELDIQAIAGIIDPTYVPPTPAPEPMAELEDESAPEDLTGPAKASPQSDEPQSGEPQPGEPQSDEPQPGEPQPVPSLEPVPLKPLPSEADRQDIPPLDELDAEAKQNPFLIPEQPVPLDPGLTPTEDVDPEDSQPEESNPLEKEPDSGDEAIVAPAEPSPEPPLLTAPDTIPAAAPLLPKASAEPPPPAPAAKGLMDRFRQWREKSVPGQSAPPELSRPGAIDSTAPSSPESRLNSVPPDRIPSPGVSSPNSATALEKTTEDEPTPELPELTPELPEPFGLEPYLTEPRSLRAPLPIDPAPASDQAPVELPRIEMADPLPEQPEVAPRPPEASPKPLAPLVPEARPFI